MAVSTFFMPAINMIGRGALSDAVDAIQAYGLHRALIVTDQGLIRDCCSVEWLLEYSSY